MKRKEYNLKIVICLIFGLFTISLSNAQAIKTNDFYKQMKDYDLSIVLMTDSLSYGEKFERSESLGFIGDDYQRFYIHFISIIKNPTHPYEYFAYGKTKVKENICTFQGTITIQSAQVYTEINPDVDSELNVKKQGFAGCTLLLFEDSKQKSTGYIKGNLTINFFIDNKNNIRYDDLMFGADSFSNNEFVGTWTSYKTTISKKCNWGDNIIPDSWPGLSLGSVDSFIDPKYVKNGWGNYMLLLSGEDEILIQKAIEKEHEKWWK
jgi:hypothetical protein